MFSGLFFLCKLYTGTLAFGISLDCAYLDGQHTREATLHRCLCLFLPLFPISCIYIYIHANQGARELLWEAPS